MIEPEQLGLSQIKLDFISGIFDAMLCVNHSLLSETSTQIVLQCLKKSSLFNLYRWFSHEQVHDIDIIILLMVSYHKP